MKPGWLSEATTCVDLEFKVKLTFSSWRSLVSHLWNSLSVPVEMLLVSVMPGPLGAEIAAPALFPPT